MTTGSPRASDFDSTGELKHAAGVVVLDEGAARGLAERLEGRTFTVAAVDTKPYTSRPKPPFITSTLQQVAGSRLRIGAQQVMRIAQGLYERGYITYMRTDSTTLSDTALSRRRARPSRRSSAPSTCRRHRGAYTKKSKNAQEAHEAIRPAGETFRSPDELRRRAPRRRPPRVRAGVAAHARVADARRPGLDGDGPADGDDVGGPARAAV